MSEINNILKNRFLSLLAATAVTVSLTACQSGETEQKLEQLDEVVSETATNAENTSSNGNDYFETTYEITEWSADDFKTIQCCGIDISIPCKLSDIDERFEIEIAKADEEKTYSVDMVELSFNDEYVGSLIYNVDNYNTETDFLTVLSLETFEINGLTETSTKEDVQKLLGSGNNIDSEYADSYFGDNMLIIFNYINGKTSIHIGVYEE